MALFTFGAVLVLALGACSRGTDARSAATGDWAATQAQEDPPAVAIEAVEVRRGAVLQRVIASGAVQGNTEVTVVAEATGAIVAVNFELGASLAADALLVQIDDTIARLSLEEARAAAEAAELDLAAAQRREQAGGASQAELSRARTAAGGARARLEAAQKTVRDHAVRTPIAGQVAAKSTDIVVGNFIQRGAVVARIVDLRTVRMTASVGELEAAALRVGDTALVTIPVCGPDPVQGVVRSIAAGSDQRTGSFPVIVTWNNACGERLRSGVSASVAIEPRGVEQQLIIPLGSVVGGNAAPAVFVVDADATVRLRRVTLGRALGDRVEVLSGIEEGEVVAISALSTLRDGAPVRATVVGRTDEVL